MTKQEISKEVRVLGIIPARGGSKGVLRKNIRNVGGKPLIAWTIEAALNSGVVGKLVVSTEDEEIADTARSYGAEIIKRPLDLAGDTVLTEPVMLHALETAEASGYKPDYVCLIQCTSPFLTAEMIRKVADLIINNPEMYDSCGTYYQPHYAFRWKKIGDGSFVSEFPVMNRPRRQDLALEYPYCGAGACYVISTALFRKTKNRYGGNDARIGGIELDERDALQIDSEYDLWLADQRMSEKLKNNS